MKTKIVEFSAVKIATLRFLRAVVPQLVLVLPVLIARGEEFNKYLPVWIVPVLICLGGIVTAIDKLARTLGWYNEIKEAINYK